MIEGVRRLALPLPFELSEVNVYLVPLSDGWMLVDAGLKHDGCFESLLAQLKQAGVELAAIRRILLTHAHPDHVGGAPRLAELTRAEIWMESREAEQMRFIAEAGPFPDWMMGPMHRAGVPADLAERVGEAFEQIRPSFSTLRPDRLLADGDLLDTAIGELQVVLTPGHSVGHASLYSQAHRTLFCGDTLLQTITPNISWMPGRDMLGEYMQSLDRLAAMEIAELLPGHFRPFTGCREWVAASHLHHEERCHQLMRALASGPRTAYQLTGEIWRRALSPFHLRFATFEILSHLEFLRRRGRVRVSERNGVEWWEGN